MMTKKYINLSRPCKERSSVRPCHSTPSQLPSGKSVPCPRLPPSLLSFLFLALHVLLELEEAVAGGVEELGVLAEREAGKVLANTGVVLAVEPVDNVSFCLCSR